MNFRNRHNFWRVQSFKFLKLMKLEKLSDTKMFQLLAGLCFHVFEFRLLEMNS